MRYAGATESEQTEKYQWVVFDAFCIACGFVSILVAHEFVKRLFKVLRVLKPGCLLKDIGKFRSHLADFL